MRMFLLDEIIKKRHQIIISTHSPVFVQGLPRSAIKAFRQNSTGKFAVVSELLSDEAFFFLGQKPSNLTRIIVEDLLAKTIVEAVLKGMGEATSRLFEVQFFPGGAKAIKQDAAVYCRENPSSVFILLDGDEGPKEPPYDPDSMSVAG
jgi:hypothetical protein